MDDLPHLAAQFRERLDDRLDSLDRRDDVLEERVNRLEKRMDRLEKLANRNGRKEAAKRIDRRDREAV